MRWTAARAPERSNYNKTRQAAEFQRFNEEAYVQIFCLFSFANTEKNVISVGQKINLIFTIYLSAQAPTEYFFLSGHFKALI